jgi:nicotinate-nucleotide adenylyltransferase
LNRTQRAIALLGGTFDPIHIGHLRTALEIYEHLACDEVRLVPCHVPPHRAAPLLSAAQRAQLVAQSVAGVPGLRCDDRELRRDGPSYTVDTLNSLRGELGMQRSLCWVVGSDAALSLHRWHRWQELLTLAHLLVVARPGQQLDDLSGPAGAWLRQHHCHDLARLHEEAGGRVFMLTLRQLDISSSAVREALACGRSVRFLVPDASLKTLEALSVSSRPTHPETGQREGT